jgi:hypothetical protein
MIQLSLLIGLLLIILGVGGYVMSDMVSPTALIPAAFGVVIGMLGLYGRAEDRRRIAMHLAMGVALVGVLGSISGVIAVLGWLLASAPGDLPLSALSKSLMAALLVLYLAMGIRSVVTARRR